MKKDKVELKWTKEIADKLVGKKIVKVEYLSSAECEDMGWYKRPILITLSDGKLLFPMADDEANDGGAMGTTYDNLQTIPVLS